MFDGFTPADRAAKKEAPRKKTALARTPWPGATATVRQGRTVPVPDSLGCHPSVKKQLIYKTYVARQEKEQKKGSESQAVNHKEENA